MGDENLNGSVDLLAKARQKVFKESVEAGLIPVNKKVDSLDKSVDSLDKKMDRKFERIGKDVGEIKESLHKLSNSLNGGAPTHS